MSSAQQPAPANGKQHVNGRQHVNPIVAIVVALLVLAGVGFLSLKLFGNGSGEEKQITVKAANPNDPRYKQDPKLGGGGG